MACRRLALVDELERQVLDFVVDRFHSFGIERAGVLDLLFADLTPARHFRWVVHIRSPGVNHVARTVNVQEVLRVAGVRRVFHRIKVIEKAEELVKAVDCRQELIDIAEMVLAELTRGIAHGFQYRRKGRRGCRNANG